MKSFNKVNMKYKIFKNTILLIIFFNVSGLVNAQNECEANTTELESLIEKKYSKLPVDGAKYIYLNNCKYIIGVGTTSSQNKNTSVMSRIASTKARREVMLLLNSPKVTSETIFETEQIIKNDNVSYKEIFRDEITEEAAAFVSGMAELTSLISSDGSTFIYVLFKSI